MIIYFTLDNGANIHSRLVKKIDTDKDLQLDEGEWEGFNEEERASFLREWADKHIELGWSYDKPKS